MVPQEDTAQAGNGRRQYEPLRAQHPDERENQRISENEMQTPAELELQHVQQKAGCA